MNTSYKTRLVEHNVPICPKCGKSHTYKLEIRYTGGPSVVLFGGKGNAIEHPSTKNPRSVSESTKWSIIFACTNTNTSFERSVSVEPGANEEIVGVQLASDSSTGPSIPESHPDFMDIELHEWVKVSAANARDFCKTMITTAIGAIPIFFAVLKYLGAEKAPSSLIAWVGIVPASTFLASTILFILALRPQYASVNTTTFDQFRTRRFKFMNRFIFIGTGLFVFGVALAIIVFIIVLYF